MAVLRIPKRERTGLATLRTMKDPVFADLQTKIEHSPASIPAAVEGVSPVGIQEVMETLTWMYRVRVAAEVAVSEFIDDVCDALREQEELRSEDEPRLRERLSKLLAIEGLNVEAKATMLYGEHANVFCSTRILTDVRPVFGVNVSEMPDAYIVTHTLKLDYHAEQGRLKEFYVALASEDLVELKIAIDRAEAKAKSIRQVLDKTNVRFVDPQHKER